MIPTPLRFILYPLFAAVCLFLFSVVLFHFDSVKHRFGTEVEKYLDGKFSVTIGNLSASLPNGVVLKSVEIRRRGDLEAQAIHIPKAKLKIALFSLLSGGREVGFDINTDKGRAHGFYALHKGGMALDISMTQFDLTLAEILAQQTDLPISGIMNGTVKIDIYPQDPLRNAGNVSLTLLDLKLAQMTFGGALQIPAIQLVQSGGESPQPSKIDISIEKGNIDIKAIQFQGGDLDLQADGKIYGARQIGNYRFNMKGNVKVSPQLAEKFPLLIAVEKQKAADGTYPLTVTGRFSNPSIRVGDFKIPII